MRGDLIGEPAGKWSWAEVLEGSITNLSGSQFMVRHPAGHTVKTRGERIQGYFPGDWKHGGWQRETCEAQLSQDREGNAHQWEAGELTPCHKETSPELWRWAPQEGLPAAPARLPCPPSAPLHESQARLEQLATGSRGVQDRTSTASVTVLRTSASLPEPRRWGLDTASRRVPGLSGRK